MTSGCQIAFQAAPSHEDPPAALHSSARTSRCCRRTGPGPAQRQLFRGDREDPVLDITGSGVVGRAFMFTADGQPAFARSLDGRLNLGGFDVCELS